MSAEEKNLIEILEEGHKVDVVKYIDYVSAPQAGAIATFSGTTRDMFEGKTVLELRYEAYVPMATRCLSSICTTARTTWDITRLQLLTVWDQFLLEKPVCSSRSHLFTVQMV